MEPFKNLLGYEAAVKIAKAFKRSSPAFAEQRFLKNLKQDLEPLELKARMHFLKNRLAEVVPTSPSQSFPVLMGALKTDSADKVGLEGFLVWPLTHFISEFGTNDFDLSMKALHAMTQVFTAEFAIRRFLITQEEKTLKMLAQWTQDPSEHVRRLVSEGTRPLLPWGEKIYRFAQNPELTWHLLEALRADPAVYVRKSVANHINDHSKNHGPWVVTKLRKWRKQNPTCKNTQWIIRHGTRTLVKKGHLGALALHGIKPTAVEVLKFKILNPRIKLGDSLNVQITLQNPTSRPAPLMLDHELNLKGSNHKYRSKIFKGKKMVLGPQEKQTFTLQIPIRKVTVRRYYSGVQYWRFILNGSPSEKLAFHLLA